MDLLDFDPQPLYYDEPLSDEVWALLEAAAEGYAEEASDAPLARALEQAPESLAVWVALYRNHFYRHRHSESLSVVEQVLALTTRRLGLSAPQDGPALAACLAKPDAPMILLRFHLMALKACAYLLLRLGQVGAGMALLEMLMELDTHDRLGVHSLLDVARQRFEPA